MTKETAKVKHLLVSRDCNTYLILYYMIAPLSEVVGSIIHFVENSHGSTSLCHGPRVQLSTESSIPTTTIYLLITDRVAGRASLDEGEWQTGCRWRRGEERRIHHATCNNRDDGVKADACSPSGTAVFQAAGTRAIFFVMHRRRPEQGRRTLQQPLRSNTLRGLVNASVGLAALAIDCDGADLTWWHPML
eukprot:scaffold35397_cov34-Cyclotella_meneghiniana.AAC.1